MEGEKGKSISWSHLSIKMLLIILFRESSVLNNKKMYCFIFVTFQKCRKLEGKSNEASKDFMALKSDAHIIAPVSLIFSIIVFFLVNWFVTDLPFFINLVVVST